MAKMFIQILSFCLVSFPLFSQTPLKTSVKGHPRLIREEVRSSVVGLLDSDEQVKKAFMQAKQSIDVYVNRHQKDPEWIISRLQMYWHTKSTEVYIKGGVFSHAGGERAPVPTVKFPGARDNVTDYAAPQLDSILPYMDDPRGVYLINKTQPGRPMEWIEISKTARILEGINTQIMQLAHTASILYWITKNEEYARFAFDLFHIYMQGMHYRKLPVDLTHGHHQTIAGLSTFEVIQEVAILTHLVSVYDYLFDYLEKNAPEKMRTYEEVFKKWAEVQIENGVAFNNWNLMQAKNILNIALILEDDSKYKDGKGQQYYVDVVLNKDFERQWSLTTIVNEGYDHNVGLWNESPGYSLGVLNDFTGFINYFDQYFDQDILQNMPVLNKAATAISQYLFPNGYISAFGDSHYEHLHTQGAEELLLHAQKYKKSGLEDSLTRFIKTILDFNKKTRGPTKSSYGDARKAGLAAMLTRQDEAIVHKAVAAGEINNYISPVFYSPKVSFLALRNGFDPKNGLMVAMSGSKGNHMHAGGISMEIFGKGMVLGPESGIGTSYFQQDYAEYYSQFPAHNTVAVDGISAYPVMKSNHGFDLISSYPASGVNKDFFSTVSFADLLFLEPETMSDQNRLIGIVRTSDSTGYYLDVFRSARRDGKDKIHDYFYHNLGQRVSHTDSSGKELNLQATSKLSFSGGHLFAYDYFWDKKSIVTPSDINTTFTLSIAGKEDVSMGMWLKGETDREIFSVKAPPSKAFRKNAMIPDSVAALSMPTLIARQRGEAWKKPFVAVYEPFTASQPKAIASITSFEPSQQVPEFVGLTIVNKSGSQQTIFSSTISDREINHQEYVFKGKFAIVGERDGSLDYLFLGNGTHLGSGPFCIEAKEEGVSAVLAKHGDDWYFTSHKPVTVTMPAVVIKGQNTLRLTVNDKETQIKGRRTKLKGIPVISFTLQSPSFVRLEWDK